MGVPVVIMRGGTSKGVFIHAKDLPAHGPARDDILLRILGSPDPLQIDGLGGTYSSTSKVVVVEQGPGDAITYWFAQIGIDDPIVDWSGNCGNLTTAVAPFAIDEGLVALPDTSSTPATVTVRLINGNTNIEIHSDVLVSASRALTLGETAIAGVPGTSSPVSTTYLDPAGGVLGALLPLGDPKSVLETPEGNFEVSLVDAAHPNLFVRLKEVAPVATIDASTVVALNADASFLSRVESIRASAAVLLGRSASVAEAKLNSPVVPRIVLVGEPSDGQADVAVLAFSMGKVHRGLPMTGALCLAAARRINGSIVSEIAGSAAATIAVQHPLGITESFAKGEDGQIEAVGVVRTARRLMQGIAFPSPR